MEMNIETQERVAGLVLRALEAEKLMNKEVGEIFGFSPIYLSFIKRRTEFHKAPRKAWEAMHDWAQLDVPLRGYKSPLKAAEEQSEAEQAAREAEALTKQQEQQQAAEAPAPEAPPLTKEEKKTKKAAHLRELYKRSKPPKKDPKPEEGKFTEPEGVPGQSGGTFIIPRGGDKADPSIISLRTGTVIFTAEVTDNEIIIRFPLVRQEVKK